MLARRALPPLSDGFDMACSLRAVAAIALALLATGVRAETNSTATPAIVGALTAEQPLPDVVEGRTDAPTTIIEYASMTCSHCAAFHKDVWPALKAKYVDTGKAKFILREFPLDPLATGAFMLARCAGPEKRDAIVDRLFDHQAEWAFDANPLAKLKEQLLAAGMSEADFDACLKNQALFDNVKKMRADAAAKLAVNSTPTFFVNGVRMSGEHSLKEFDEILSR
jgi:protein-disulfide isomerase